MCSAAFAGLMNLGSNPNSNPNPNPNPNPFAGLMNLGSAYEVNVRVASLNLFREIFALETTTLKMASQSHIV